MKSNNRVETIFSLVTYQAPEHFLKCLRSIEWTKDHEEIQVIVIDNSPSDEIKQIIDRSEINIIYESSGSNIGYGKAHNRSYQLATEFFDPKQIMILNYDLTFEERDYNKLLEVLYEDPSNLITAPQLIGADGEVEGSILTDPSSFAYFINFTQQLFNSGVDKQVGMRHSHSTETVKGVSGACMMIKREAIVGDKIFDPDYQMYFEDLDLCHRIRESGGNIVYVPEVQVEHAAGASSVDFENRSEWQREMTYVSLSTYFRKNKSSFDTAFLMFTLNTALRLRMLMGRDKEWAQEIYNRINK